MHPRILKLKSLFFRIDFTRRSKFLTHALQLNQKLQKLNRRSLKTRKTLFYFHLCALTRRRRLSAHIPSSSEFVEKTFQATQLTHERFLTIDHSCKVFFFSFISAKLNFHKLLVCSMYYMLRIVLHTRGFSTIDHSCKISFG